MTNDADNDVDVWLMPPVCSRCRQFCSWTELLEVDPEVKAKMIDEKFVCARCLTESEKV